MVGDNSQAFHTDIPFRKRKKTWKHLNVGIVESKRRMKKEVSCPKLVYFKENRIKEKR